MANEIRTTRDLHEVARWHNELGRDGYLRLRRVGEVELRLDGNGLSVEGVTWLGEANEVLPQGVTPGPDDPGSLSLSVWHREWMFGIDVPLWEVPEIEVEVVRL